MKKKLSGDCGRVYDCRFWDYTWTNWCDLVEGGCPGAEIESQLERAVDGIQWDPELQERIREELLMQHQIPEIHISK